MGRLLGQGVGNPNSVGPDAMSQSTEGHAQSLFVLLLYRFELYPSIIHIPMHFKVGYILRITIVMMGATAVGSICGYLVQGVEKVWVVESRLYPGQYKLAKKL